MKKLHQDTLFCWSQFDEARNIDFHSYLWIRKQGNVAIDPLELSSHDEKHLNALGKLSYILMTNSDHIRDAATLASKTGAELWGPRQEKTTFPLTCSKWLGEGSNVLPGLKVFEMEGSKTPGELVFLIENSTLVTGDLIRSHQGGQLCLLPEDKLNDRDKAITSVAKLINTIQVKAVLPGDGWPIFRDGQRVLVELLEELRGP